MLGLLINYIYRYIFIHIGGARSLFLLEPKCGTITSKVTPWVPALGCLHLHSWMGARWGSPLCKGGPELSPRHFFENLLSKSCFLMP